MNTGNSSINNASGGNGTPSSVFSPRGNGSTSHNRYNLTSNGSRTPRVFPPDVHAIPLSPSKLDSPFFRDRVQTLMQQGDSYAKRLDLEKRRTQELDLCLMRLRELHLETRKKLCTTTNAQLCAATSDVKSIRTLENRLDKVLTRYNEVCNANKKLREEIQSLRRDKVQQQHIHDTLERETHQVQSEIGQIASATQAASDARERANRQTESIKAQLADDDHDFTIDWQEKRVQLEQDRANIRDIPRMRTPSAKTHFLPSNNGRGNGNGSTGNTVRTTSGPLGGFKLLSTPDIKLRDETLKNVWLLNEKEHDLRKQSERLKEIEDGLLKIKKKTGVQDADELAQALLAAEEKNFSLFNLINELNTEMEALEIDNNALEQQIEQCKGSAGHNSNSDAHRQELKQHLEDQIEKSKQKVRYFELRQNETVDVLDTMKTGALSIFHKIGHSDDAFAQQLLAHGLTDVTMAKVLGAIEQRIGELVDMHNIATNATATSPMKTEPSMETAAGGSHLKTSNKKGGNNNQPPTSPHQHHHHTANSISLLRPTPPAADDFGDSDNDDSEDAVRPCKISEIQEKTAAAVGKRKDKQSRTKR